VVVGGGLACVTVLCTTSLAWAWCAFEWTRSAAALVVVVAVAGVDVVVAAGAGAGGLGLLVEVDDVEDAEPHALTASVRRTAAPGMRRSLMVSPWPPGWWLVWKDVARSVLLPKLCERCVKRSNRI
jgi:hypothetical protein